ncbi:hypothetical protein [Nonomuraea sp. NPDC049028]
MPVIRDGPPPPNFTDEERALQRRLGGQLMPGVFNLDCAEMLPSVFPS